MDFSKKVKFTDSVLGQEVDGEMVLLDMNSENYFGLDIVATDIWNLFQEGKTLQETYEELLEIYDVDPDILFQDLESFIEDLLNHNLIKLV